MSSYPAVIELRVDGITQVTRVLDSIEKLDRALISIKKTPLAIDSGNVTNGIRVLKKEVDDFIIKLGTGKAQLASTTAGLNAQAAAFKNLAANVKIGSQSFKLYTQAAEQARQKTALTGGLAEIKALRDAYLVGRTAPNQSFKGVEELIKFGAQVPKNTASLQLYEAELQRVLSLVDYGTKDYWELEKAIAAVNRQLQVGQGLGPVQGPAALTGRGTAGTRGRQAGGSSRFAGALSNAVIGASFPLLFGQSGGAAVGGAVGGLAGSLLGPGGGFAGSLLGTLLGEVASKGQQVKELASDIGFTAEQAQKLQEAFALAGRDSDKFIASVQNIRGLSLSLDDQADAIQLVTNLTEIYGGKIDKVTNAFTSALESGKVTQATLNQLGNEGIPIQETLAKKYDTSRSNILQMAKDGKISVQDLTDTLVILGNTAEGEAEKTVTGWSAAWKDLQRGASLSLQAVVAVFSGITSAGIQSSGNIAADFSAMYVYLVKGAISMGVRISSIFANLARGAANLAATVELGGINITAAPAKKGFKALEGVFARINTNLQNIDVAEPTFGKVGGITAPGQLPPEAGGKKAKDKAAEEAARLAAEIRGIQMQTEATKQLAYLKGNIVQAEIANNKELAIRLEGELRNQQILISYQESLEGVTSEQKKQALLAKAQAELQASNIETAGNLERFEADRTKAFEDQVTSLDLQLQLRTTTTEEARRQLQIEYEIQKLRKEGTFTEPQLGILQQKMLAAGAPVLGADLIKQEIGKISDEMVKLTDVGTMAIGIADSIGSAFANSFKGIISGSMSAQEALASFFQSVADYFLDMAAQIIQKWIQMTILNQILQLFPTGASALSLGSANFGSTNFEAFDGSSFDAAAFGGAMASGGPVSSNRMYMVGEQGPELFVPGRSGAIVPNNQLGASTNVVVNVDAKGTSVQGNDQTGNQLARAVAAAVQAELVKQRRPGGLLTV